MNVVEIMAKPHKPARPHITISAQNVAKATRGARERGYLSAGWVRGEVSLIEPTIALAARVFGVSIPTVRDALDELKDVPIAVPSFDDVWLAKTSTERDAFVRKHAEELWMRFDRVTAAA
jgi:hypothetical protein